ncbi:hypothetical protein Rsub_01114 [Raphidocelis subcapitata]|uniref:Coenzyme Q-binding protein COQ10 START domain-containing protein n=1 Tax=Raphidocelis subcapitata TaxID=307507 RepID=A0A2V0NPD8_9CHLO|nr:hypothetical protein Rsub_01114 [Raphidocelis subcapitata]|eukprot:GBF88402.1 hypothetical protein Rsub_01114 [Raphidocelis subcapitata]
MGAPPPGSDAGAGDATPSVEDWSEKNQKIVVRTTPGSGYLADLVLRSKVDATPDEVYSVLTHPDSHSIFRGIKATLERRTLEEDGRGWRKLLVSHQAVTRFLWLHVTFSTQLLVEEDDKARTITFQNARDGGFMRTFTGKWEVLPFSQETLDRIYRPEEQQQQGRRGLGWLNPVGALGALQHRVSDAVGGRPGRGCALVTLEQAIAPRVMPPGPLMRMVRGMCARTVINMMDDLQAEIHRRRAEDDSPDGSTRGSGGSGKDEPKAAGTRGSTACEAAAAAGHGAGQQHQLACLSARGLDLFAGAAPLQITIEL